MKTIEIRHLPSQVALNWGALRASAKRSTSVGALPSVTLVRPRVVVDARSVARYGAVCGYARAQGVPLLYPQVLAFPLSMMLFGSKDYPWPAMGTVHLAQSAQQFERIYVGDELRIELQTGDLLTHEKGQVFTLHTRAFRGARLMWQGHGHYLRMGIQDKTGPAYASALIDPSPLSHQADFYADSGMGRRYGLASGDVNPIHLFAWTARVLGFKRAIAHGMWTAARALATVMPREPVEQADVCAEFKTPLFLPAQASLWTSRKEGETLFEVRSARGDKPHLRATAHF